MEAASPVPGLRVIDGTLQQDWVAWLAPTALFAGVASAFGVEAYLLRNHKHPLTDYARHAQRRWPVRSRAALMGAASAWGC